MANKTTPNLTQDVKTKDLDFGKVVIIVLAMMYTYSLALFYRVPKQLGVYLLVTVTLITTFFLVVAPIPQNKKYHNFADNRSGSCFLCGSGRKKGQKVPNFFDVMSNIPFTLAGILGFVITDASTFHSEWEMTAWKIFYAGIFLVAIGSAYYHWNPNNETLVWDRLPMTIAFMSLFSILIGERFLLSLGEATVYPFLVCGALSVFYWHYTDDLRPYIVVQFYPLASICFLLMLEPSYTNNYFQFICFVFYVLAKIVEEKDREIYAATNRTVSGHTLKHLSAAVGPVALAVMLSSRSEISPKL